MPIIQDPFLDTPERRFVSFMTEQRGANTLPVKESPGFSEVFSAAARTQNIIGSFVANRGARILAGYSPLYGSRINPDRRFDPFRFLADEEFYLEHPYAIEGYEQLASAQDEQEFELTLLTLRQHHEDFQTIVESGGTGMFLSLAVNFVDPLNFLPYGAAWKVAQGARASSLLLNVGRGAVIGAAGNVAQEEALRAIQPGTPTSRVESNLVAAGFGVVFGGALSFLAAPNLPARRRFPSMGADDAAVYVPPSRLAKIEKRVQEMFDQEFPDVSGAPTKPRNFVRPLEDTEFELRRMLEEESIDDANVTPLFREGTADDTPVADRAKQGRVAEAAGDEIGARDARQGVTMDENARLLQKLQAKYDREGKNLIVNRHPLQDDYDAFTPVERSLNDAMFRIRQRLGEATNQGAAGPADLEGGRVDRAVRQGTTPVAKALQVVTPQRALDRAGELLDSVNGIRRAYFYDPNISRSSAAFEEASGPVPAEALKDMYQAELGNMSRRVRQAYDPSARLSVAFGRDEAGNLDFQGFRKAAAKFKRSPITYTNALGDTTTIPGFGHYESFKRAVNEIIREQRAIGDGFVTDNLQRLPPELNEAVEAVKEYYADILNRADEAGYLPGPKTLERARADRDTLAEELIRAEQEYRDTEGVRTATEIQEAIDEIDQRLENPDTSPEEAASARAKRAELEQEMDQQAVKDVYTNIPPELIGRELFDWGAKGLRISGTQEGPINVTGQRPRSFWDNNWSVDLTRIDTGNPQMLRAIRQVTDEVFPVRQQRGKFSNTKYYLVPKRAIERAEQIQQRSARTQAEKAFRKAERDYAAADASVADIEEFLLTADTFQPRRYIQDAIRTNKEGFKDFAKRSWARKRNMSYDPETGERIRLTDLERPIVPELRERLKISEVIRSEGDLLEQQRGNIDILNQPFEEGDAVRVAGVKGRARIRSIEDDTARVTIRNDEGQRTISMRLDELEPAEPRQRQMQSNIYDQYRRELELFNEESAERLYQTLTDPKNAHGIEHAFTTPNSFKGRTLTLDEADPAAAEFMDTDIERIAAGYHHTVNGRIATHTATRRAADMLRKQGIETQIIDSDGKLRDATPQDILNQLSRQFDELVNSLAEFDRQTGESLTPQVQRTQQKAMLRFDRKVAQLEGQGLTDPTAGANALWAWGGRQLLNMNYLALLGSQTLAAINDVAALTIYADITSVPRNVRYLQQAIAPLKDASRRDLELMRLGFENELSRAQSLADLDFDSATNGVGFGRTRQVTAGVEAGLNKLNQAFNEVTMINTWNRKAKRAAAFISMDRLLDHSRRLLRARELEVTGGSQGQGLPRAEALRAAGLSQTDAARIAQRGIDETKARQMLSLIRRHGTDEDGNLLSELSDEAWNNYRGIALPNARKWLEEDPANREVYDIYLTAINTEVEKGMVISPGLLDQPLMNDHWWGRAINQFQTFNMAWANQVARPLSQRPAGKQMAAIGAYFGTGAFVDAIRNHLSGRRDFDETARLWMSNPQGMTYAVVNTSGLSGWFNRPLAFFDKSGFGPGALLNNTEIARSAYQSRTFWGSLSPSADFLDRTLYGGTGWASKNGMQVQHWHALRKSIPLQNLIWFRLNSRLTGVDPLVTENLIRQSYDEERPPEP